MIKKKDQREPEEHEFTALDAAVSQLSKQTEALLGSAKKEETKKPVLPKKNTLPVSRGQSFDIINTNTPSKPAVLKTAVPVRAVVDTKEQHPLLSEHAGYSFNESDPGQLVKSPLSTPPTVAPTVSSAIAGHSSTIMQMEPAATEDSTEVLRVKGEGVRLDVETIATDSSLSVAEKVPDELEINEEDAVISDESSSEDEPEHTEAPSSGFENSGIYANNFSPNKEPQRYEPHQNQQKPTVFDTNEYHEPLHDWSKLEHKSTLKVAILLLLLVLATGVAYVAISGKLFF